MSRCKCNSLVTLIILSLILVISSKSFAQESESKDPFDLDPFGLQTNEGIERANESTNPDSLDPNLVSLQSSQSETLKVESDSTPAESLRTDELSVNSAVYAPMAGMADTMFSKAYANQTSHFLASPMVLYNTTMQLTEPAVAAGVHNSTMQSYGALQARYLAEQNFIIKLDKDPDTKLIMLRAYTDCVASLIRKTGSTEDEVTWIEAQSRCMADRAKNIEALNSGSTGGRNFDNISPVGVTGEGYDFTYDASNPNVEASDGDGGGSPGGGAPVKTQTNSILLTDFLFDASSSTKVKDVDQFKTSFAKLFGDYNIEFDGNSKVRSANRTLKTTLIQAKPEARAKFKNDKAEFVFDTINGLLKKRCKHKAQADSLVNDNLFCRVEPNIKDKFIDISFIGYGFNCSMLEGLYLTFTYDNPALFGSASDAACDKVFSKTYAEFSSFGSKSNPLTKIKGGYEFVIRLTDQISSGQIYQYIDIVSSKVEELTGSNKIFALNLAHKLIREFIGGKNLNQLLLNTVYDIAAVKKKIDDLNDVKGGQGLSTLYNN